MVFQLCEQHPPKKVNKVQVYMGSIWPWSMEVEVELGIMVQLHIRDNCKSMR